MYMCVCVYVYLQLEKGYTNVPQTRCSYTLKPVKYFGKVKYPKKCNTMIMLLFSQYSCISD
jgi:hypothetical protein